jgi:trans-aconitate 2-methyltransferase
MPTREWDAVSYHRLSNRQHEWGQKVLARLALRGDETIIDAGCGTCRVTSELAGLIPRGRVLAVDLSENMLVKARGYLSSAEAGGNQKSIITNQKSPIHLICADLAALPFREIADGIFSTAAFHWVKDHDRLFQNLHIALKPGGWLEAQCGGGPNLLRLRQRAEVLMSRAPFAPYFAGWQPPQFYADQQSTEQRLRAAGFLGIAVWVHPAGFAIDNADEYRQYLATVTLHQHVARITEPALRERFLDELTNQALADPELHLDYWRMNIHARKEL